jgi:hypothetical protein
LRSKTLSLKEIIMISVFWVFVGFLTGLLITAVFDPAPRKVLSVPTPEDTSTLNTGVGCVKFRSEEVPCDGKETPLNVIASQHK